MSKIVLGLVGRKQSGKDSIADFLVENHGYTQIAFADALRAVALGANPVVTINPVMHYAEALEKYGYEGAKQTLPLFREFLQNLGTEGVRAVDPDFWINLAARKIEEIPGHVVVTDVRFQNEYDTIKRFNGHTVRVTRPGYSDAPTQHESESNLDAWDTDYEIVNDSSLVFLCERASLLHEEIS